MDHWARRAKEYWEGRLAEKRIFFKPSLRRPDFDYKLRGESTEDWPFYVAKEALYNDYLVWQLDKAGMIMPISELFRLLEPYLYPFGKRAHTRRSNVARLIHVGGGRQLEGKAMRAFVRVPPYEVMNSWYKLQTGRGTLSERELWKSVVVNGQEGFGHVAEVPHLDSRP